MKETLIDIETYCETDIKKCGLYRYVSDPSFEILLIAWATDEGSGFGETRLVDLASGEPFPQELLDDFKDSKVTLIAHNAAFERVSFSRYLQQQYPGQYLEPGAFLSPDRWICTMVMAASLKLAESLNQKYGEGAVFINKVVINNMDFEEAYNTAIQQKSIAQQNADKQKIENEAAIAKAEADKQVAITNAEAEAQKTSIAADAQAEANRKIAESLSDTLIEYQKIQKWDGKLPTVSGSNALVSFDPAE